MAKIKYTWIFLLCSVLLHSVCDGHKLLVLFPFPGKSHGILGEGYVRTLLDTGHEVTYIAAVPIKDPLPRFRQIDVSNNFDIYPIESFLNVNAIMDGEFTLSAAFEFIFLSLDMMNSTILNEEVQALMMDPKEQFDAVIVEWMFMELYGGFAAVFGCPLIWSSSMEPHALVLSKIDEVPNPAYVPDQMTQEKMPFGFLGRVRSLLVTLSMKLYYWYTSSYEMQIYNEGFGPAAAKRGRQLPPLDEVRYNASLMLGNSHMTSGQALRLPQNYKAIGGYHIELNRCLRYKTHLNDLQKIMDDATHGVIYFSMGTMLKSTHMPQSLKLGLLNLFASFKQTVIWKFEETLPNLPKNVHIVQWAPQQSILAHPNCILFITHGGLLSTFEALHFGVPFIGIPMYGDQYNNVNSAESKGIAIRVDISFDGMPAQLKIAMEEMLGNPKYKNTMKEMSFAFRHRPVSPRAELLHWIDHVVQTRGAPHMRSPALHMPFYEKMFLDLMALMFVVVLAIRYTFNFLCRSKRKVDLVKKRK